MLPEISHDVNQRVAYRARLFRYEFAPPDDPTGAWWKRTALGPWIPPLSADDPRLRRFLAMYGWS